MIDEAQRVQPSRATTSSLMNNSPAGTYGCRTMHQRMFATIQPTGSIYPVENSERDHVGVPIALLASIDVFDPWMFDNQPTLNGSPDKQGTSPQAKADLYRNAISIGDGDSIILYYVIERGHSTFLVVVVWLVDAGTIPGWPAAGAELPGVAWQASCPSSYSQNPPTPSDPNPPIK